jgi:ABC-type Na+ transport system ATPase subunit NatA
MQQPNPSAKTTLMHQFKTFLNDSSGAVTVDWIVLTAALVAMVVAFMAGFTADVDGFLVVLMASL